MELFDFRGLITIDRFIRNYEDGDYSTSDAIEEIDYEGWSDWYCPNKALVNKTKRIYEVLKGIKNPYILNNFGVWFTMYNPKTDACKFESIEEDYDKEVFFEIKFKGSGKNTRFTVFTGRGLYSAIDGCTFDTQEELIECLNILRG